MGEDFPQMEGAADCTELGIPEHLITFRVMRRTLGTSDVA